MREVLLSVSAYLGGIPDRIRPWRWLILLLATAGTLLSLYFTLTRFEMDVTIDSWFDQNDPAMQALNDFRGQFGSDDGVFLVFEAKDGDVFSNSSLTAIRKMTERIKHWHTLERPEAVTETDWEMLTHIKRVQSITNAKVQINEDDTLRSEYLIPATIPNEASILSAIKSLADQQTGFPLFYYSPDRRFGGINIQTDFGAIPKDVTSYDESAQNLGLDELDTAFNDFELTFDGTVADEAIQYKQTEFTEYMAFMTSLSAIYEQAEFLQHFAFYPVGNPAMMDLVMETQIQALFLVLLMIVVIIILLWMLLHSLSAVVWPIVAIGLSALWTAGMTTLLGYDVSTLFALTVMLILAVGIADCVHVMSTYLFYRREGVEHTKALTETYHKTALPILLTTITTMAGMSALTITGMPQFVVFGFSSAGGVFLALVFTYFLLPILMDFWHPLKVKKNTISHQEKPLWQGTLNTFSTWCLFVPRQINSLLKTLRIDRLNPSHWLQPCLDSIPQLVHKAPYTIASLFIGIFVLCFYGAFQVRIDSNLVELYKEGTEFRTAYKVVDENMMGTSNLEIMIDLKQSDALLDYRALQAIENLQTMISSKYSDYVVRVFSLADLVKDTNKIMHDGTDAYHFIPKDNLSVSQLLYLFNSSNPEERRALVSDDYSRSHISVSMRNAGSYEYSVFFETMQEDINLAFSELKSSYPNMEITTTGSLAMMMRLANDLSENQFKSLSLAVLVISLIMILTLGSVQAGVLAIIPNMIPAVLTFGLMGWLKIPLDTDTLMIAPLIIGIAVDDTIHFITHYRMALAKHGEIQTALISAIKEVGQAVAFTSMVLGFGFFMLTFSDYLGFAKMGGFGALAIFVALLCDLLFLPALIMIFKPTFGQKDVNYDMNFSASRESSTQNSHEADLK